MKRRAEESTVLRERTAMQMGWAVYCLCEHFVECQKKTVERESIINLIKCTASLQRRLSDRETEKEREKRRRRTAS